MQMTVDFFLPLFPLHPPSNFVNKLDRILLFAAHTNYQAIQATSKMISYSITNCTPSPSLLQISCDLPEGLDKLIESADIVLPNDSNLEDFYSLCENWLERFQNS